MVMIVMAITKGFFYNYSSCRARLGKDGYNHRGFNRFGVHKETGTLYDPEGFDRFGFNEGGINKYTGTRYDPDGYDKDGLDQFRLPRLDTIGGGLPPPPMPEPHPHPPIPPVPPFPPAPSSC